MNNLLISKIEGIEVHQYEESSLDITNKAIDGSKVSKRRKSKIKRRKSRTKTVDGGKKEEKLTFSFFVDKKSQNNKMISLLRKRKTITITDKFKGSFKVFLNDVKIVDGDQNIGVTIYRLSCTVQDAELVSRTDERAELNSKKEELEEELSPSLMELAKKAISGETEINKETGKLSFIDSALDTVFQGLNKALDAKDSPFDAVNKVRQKLKAKDDLLGSLNNIKNAPLAAIFVVKAIVKQSESDLESVKSLKDFELGDLSNDKYKELQRTSAQSQPVSIARPRIRGKYYDEIDKDTLSQFDIEELEKKILAANIVNKVILIQEFNLILNGNFNNEDDFNRTVKTALKRIPHIGYESWKESNLMNNVKALAYGQEYKHIEIISVDLPTPLIRIVYDRYGNIDNYFEILLLNGFKDNDAVIGKVKVFK